MKTIKLNHSIMVVLIALAGVTASVQAADLALFGNDAKWEFKKNTGNGSFTVATDADGKRIGILNYDFSNPLGAKTPYVIAFTPVEIAEGSSHVVLSARSSLAQPLTFRLVDSTGQTHQFKSRIKGSGQWETIKIPMTRKLEHWGGAADGTIHYPVRSIAISVPRPSETATVGKVEFADIKVE
jgi:hypothetical protein